MLQATPGKSSTALIVDASGNIYITGTFGGTVDFNTGPDTYNLTANGRSDAFITKLNAAGNFVWAKNMGGTPGRGGAGANSIAVDVGGNVYTTGFFFNDADFDPGAGVYNLTAAGYGDIFLSKLDSSGNFIWAENLGGNSQSTVYDPDDEGYSIRVDAVGNIYASGHFNDTADFNPGDGVYNLTSNGKKDIFVIKLGQQNTLPLSLLNFSAKAINNRRVNLQWQTALEENTAKFIVERSVNQRTFSAVGTVDAAGTGMSHKTYFFEDAEPLRGTNFYRLKMLDKNGSFTYSKVETVKLSGDNSFDIYPNPATSFIQLKFNRQLKGKVQIEIIDAAGKSMLRHAVDAQNLTGLSISKLLKGSYLVKVTTEGEVFVRKMLIK